MSKFLDMFDPRIDAEGVAFMRGVVVGFVVGCCTMIIVAAVVL